MKGNKLYLLWLLLFCSCDLPVGIQGRVVEARTGNPLKGVTVYEKRTGRFVFSDSLGKFQFNDIRSGHIGSPKKVKLEFIKDTFAVTKMTYRAADTGRVVKMKRLHVHDL